MSFLGGMLRDQNFEIFSPSLYHFAAVIDLLLGLLPVQKILRKHYHQDMQILSWSNHVQRQAILR